jgi:hypothetical protein
MQVNYKIYFCFTLRVISWAEWFCFTLPPQVGFVLHYHPKLVLFYTTVFSILFYTNPIFPPCFTLWVNPPCFTLWGRGRPCPFVGRSVAAWQPYYLQRQRRAFLRPWWDDIFFLVSLHGWKFKGLKWAKNRSKLRLYFLQIVGHTV